MSLVLFLEGPAFLLLLLAAYLCGAVWGRSQIGRARDWLRKRGLV